MSIEATNDYMVELMARLTDLNERADELHTEWEELAEGAKLRKKEWEAAVREIQRLIRAANEPELPLFTTAAHAATDAPSDDVIDADFLAIEGPARLKDLDAEDAAVRANGKASHDGVSPDESWRSARLDTLEGLSLRILTALEGAKIFTVGDLAEYTKANALTDVDGIGEAAATKIFAALDAFWASRKGGFDAA